MWTTQTAWMMIFAVSSRLEWVIKVSLAPSNLNLLQFLYTLVAMGTIVVILFFAYYDFKKPMNVCLIYLDNDNTQESFMSFNRIIDRGHLHTIKSANENYPVDLPHRSPPRSGCLWCTGSEFRCSDPPLPFCEMSPTLFSV